MKLTTLEAKHHGKDRRPVPAFQVALTLALMLALPVASCYVAYPFVLLRFVESRWQPRGPMASSCPNCRPCAVVVVVVPTWYFSSFSNEVQESQEENPKVNVVAIDDATVLQNCGCCVKQTDEPVI